MPPSSISRGRIDRPPPCIYMRFLRTGREFQKFDQGELKKALTARGKGYRFLAYLLILMAFMASTAGCAMPEASLTPPSLGSATPTPNSVPSVTVELSDKVDSTGTLLGDVEVISGDGVAVLYIAKGTKVVDAQGLPLDFIAVTARWSEEESYEQYPSIGLVYDFAPGGARFEPPAQLIMSYDPSLITREINKYSVQVAYFDTAESIWIRLEGKADVDINTVIAEIEYLGSFIISFEWYSIPIS
jgi:hypothetical protein